MAKRPIILEFLYTKKVGEYMSTFSLDSKRTLKVNLTPSISTFQPDMEFDITRVPKVFRLSEKDLNNLFRDKKNLYDTTADMAFDSSPDASTYIIRGTVDDELDKNLEKFKAEISMNKNIVGYYADAQIEPFVVCGGGPVGNDRDVERLLCVSKLAEKRMTGRGINVAIVDTGVNMAYLNSRGKNPIFDGANSWSPNPAIIPGQAPVGHGTMCAFDVCISAPECTLIDIALLTSRAGGGFQGFLSDAIRAYDHLIRFMTSGGGGKTLVVNNSWGMFHPSWDLPVGDPGNYSDNPNHPFNRIVAALERTGADILFAAGNCGADCPDGRCQGFVDRPIYGANSHPAVLSVAGVDTTKLRVGYSSIGPGRLENRKPDICGYTHFSGSGVYPADGGTSAACPVVSGVVAAIRTLKPYNPSDSNSSPAAIRNLITSTALDLGASGYDYQYGHGVVDPCKIIKRFEPIRPQVIDICKRYPWFCRQIHPDLCKRFPNLCRPIPFPPFPPKPPIFPPIPPRPGFGWNPEQGIDEESVDSGEGEDNPEIILAYYAGLMAGIEAPSQEKDSHDCKCKKP